MIHVIVIENPFDKRRRKDYLLPDEGKAVSSLVKTEGPKIYSISGKVVEASTVPHDGDEVVIMPRIEKKGLGIVLTIGLTILSAGVASGAWWALNAANWAIGWRIGVSLALTFLGNYVSSKLTPKPHIDISNTEQSNTYGWNGMQTISSQGGVLPVVYGTVKTAGTMLQRHVDEDGSKEYLSILYCLAEGPIDDISNIKLNSNPVENYTGVEIETRNGAANQKIISNFNNSYAETALAYELDPKDGWRTVTLDGNSANGIQIHIAFPAGLYYTNNDGNPDWTSVTIEIQYRKKGDANWIGVPIRNENAFWDPNSKLSGKKWVRRMQLALAGGDMWRAAYNNDCRYIAGYQTYTYWRRGRKHEYYVYDDDGDRIPIYGYTMSFEDWKAKMDREHNYQGVIKAKETAAFYRSYTIDGLASAQYEVRMRCSHKDRTDTRTCNKIQWLGVDQIIYDDFTYPGKALLGLKALATDQLSGSDPQMTCYISRDWIYAWNPDTKQYEKKPANNPAWAAYDILHHCLKFGNAYEVQGVPKESMDYHSFEAWANECDKNEIEFNYLYDSAMQVSEALQYPSRVGRGAVIMCGTKYSCVYDFAAQPSQLFTMANIKEGTFKEEFQDIGERANAIEVSFMNKDKDYDRDVLTVFNDDYDAQDNNTQPTQVELMGCTSAEQAYRYGKFYLRENKYEIRTVTFEAWTDAIACTVGDVILLQHDITDWGDGGRVVSVDAEHKTVILDHEIKSDCNKIIVRDQQTDKLYEADIITISGESITVSNADGFSEGAVFAAGTKGREAKKFKVTSIKKNESETTREITAVEYYDELYSADLDAVPEIARYDSAVEPPKDLMITDESYKDSGGQRIYLVHVSWRNPRSFDNVILEVYNAETRFHDKQEFKAGENSYTFNAVGGKNYNITIYARNAVGMISEKISNTVYTNGKDSLPPDVQVLNVESMSSGIRRYWWKFDYPTPNDIAGFRMKYSRDTQPTWETGTPVQKGLITSQPFESQTVRSGINTIMIKAVDNAGNESKNFASVIVNFGNLVRNNLLFEKDFSKYGWNNDLKTNGLIKNWKIYEQETNAFWSQAEEMPFWRKEAKEPYWDNPYEQFEAVGTFVSPVSGQMWVDSKFEGNGVIYYRKFLSNPFWKVNDDDSFWDDNMWPDTEEYDIWKQYSDRVNINAGDVIQVKAQSMPGKSRNALAELKITVDVPNRIEHFENVQIPVAGAELPIQTPEYFTSSVHIDAVEEGGPIKMQPIFVSKNPCVIKVVDNAGNPAAVMADLTWQGYSVQKISDGRKGG